MGYRGNDYCGHDGHKHGATTVVLTSGTTTVGDQSSDGTNFVFAGASIADAPTLQFIGAVGSMDTYSPRSFTANHGDGVINMGFAASVDVTNGLHINQGTINLEQDIGSNFIVDGNSSIDNNGTIYDISGGYNANAAFVVNGTLTVGANGANALRLGSVGGVGGMGTIRQIGKNDVTVVGSVNTGIRLDIRAGDLIITGSAIPSVFSGTIGPAAGSHAPSLGPSAMVQVAGSDLFNFLGADLGVQSAKFDTATGMLSLLGSGGRDLGALHFSGNASGLEISPWPVTDGSYIQITDHPGEVSPIPITFT